MFQLNEKIAVVTGSGTLRTDVEHFMHKRKSDKKQVQKYFNVGHLRYAA